jgi:ATP/maltotriose-dependent transcriptional regulator MalT/DNA-binding SARP family transcriptional activator
VHLQPTTSRRFLARLADGVGRSRITEPILNGCPTTVVIGAPSGYGKTCVAAQLANAGPFETVVWLDAGGDHGSIEDVISRLAAAIRIDPIEAAEPEVGDFLHACMTEVAAWPDDRSLLVVLDDASWAQSQCDLDSIIRVIAEAPRRSMLVVTTRSRVPHDGLPDAVWEIGPSELLFDDNELAELWQTVSGTPPDSADLVGLADQSGGHPALAALTLRRGVIAGRTTPGDSGSDGLAALVNTLVEAQLGPLEQQVFDLAGLLVTGTLADLARCVGRGDVASDILRVSSVLPLVHVSGRGANARFSVHDIACCSATGPALQRLSPEVLRRVVEVVLRDGRCARAVEIAMQRRDDALLGDTLLACADRLFASNQHDLVHDAIESMPTSLLLERPSLLLIRARELAHRGDLGEAVRVARLVVGLCEQGDDERGRVGAQAVLAHLRAKSGDTEGLADGIENVLERSLAAGDTGHIGEAIAAAVAGYGFAGDRTGLGRCLLLGKNLRISAPRDSEAQIRIAAVRSLLIHTLDGDFPTAAHCARVLACNPAVRVGRRASLLTNAAASYFSAGMIAEAREAIAQAMCLAADSADRSDEATVVALGAAIDAFQGRRVDWRSRTESLIAYADEVGNGILAVTTMLITAPLAMALGETEYARALADRAIFVAAETSSPVFVWLAELAQAQSLLAAGDSARARDIAERVLPHVEPIAAMGHVLSARMILAEDALAGARYDEAVAHVAAVADYITEKSPVLAMVSYLRPFPDLLAALCAAMGADRVPARILRWIEWSDGLTAGSAWDMVSPGERDRLRARTLAAAAEAELAEAEPPEAPADVVCTVRLLGGFEVHTPEGQVSDRAWTKRKARLLFAMLVSRSGSDIPRDQIIEYLWPDMEEQRALNNFYVVWSAMKRALMPASAREVPCPYVEHVRGVCRVVPGRVNTDLATFEHLLASARKARGAHDDQTELTSLLQLAELYRGDLLPGDTYDDWFAPLRNRCRQEYEDAMLRAAQLLEGVGEQRQALGLVRRALDQDPWREDLYQAALRLQIAAGQRSAAIDTYMSCRARLVDDLGIDPSGETTRLYEHVLGMEDAGA